MGGIAGIVHFRGDAPDRAQAQILAQGIAHRGRDGQGTFAEGPAILVQASFRAAPDMPVEPAVSDGTAMVVEGRLWGPGVPGLLASWDERGKASLPPLDGPFALAAWSRRRQVLQLARDPHGTCPLFWTREGTQLAFASEIPALLALPWVRRRLATDNLSEYLSFRYVHAPRTLFRDIHAVPPGHILRADADGVDLVRWWTPRWAPVGTAVTDERETVERVDATLRRSVERRLPAESQVAVLLSGGLDSSAILHHAAERVGPRPLTFTVTLEDDAADESAIANRVARVMNAEHTLVRIENEQLIDAVDECTRVMGHPLPSAAGAVQHVLYQAIAPTARVVLSGDGGDEILGGRGMEGIGRRLRAVRALDHLPDPARELTRIVARKTGRTDLAASHVHFGRDRNIGGSRVFHSAERVAVLREPGMVRPGIRRTVLEPLYQEVVSDPINAILYVWQRGWLPEDSLARSDRMAAHAGIEVRYPMLDPAMVQLTSALPGDAKVVPRGLGYVTKWPLRRAMEDRLPRSFLNRPKRSLPNPLDGWLRTFGREFLRWRIDAICQDETGLFAPTEVQRLQKEHIEGLKNHGLKLWTLCLFQAWREIYCT